MARFSITLMVAILVVLPGTAPALAHKLKVFATAIGAGVEGRVYFVGGGAALDVPVALTDSTGTVTATARTQSPDGSFVLTLPYRDDFTLTADAQDGHVAAFSLRSNRLSDTLPSAPHAIVADAQSAAQAPAPPEASRGSNIDAIEQAVARQIAPLADQVDTMQATIGVRDVVGGIGYILGIFGLWALFAGRRGWHK